MTSGKHADQKTKEEELAERLDKDRRTMREMKSRRLNL